MTVEQILAKLARMRITLFLDGGRLRYRAPKGALTPQMREVIAENRKAIIERLRDRKNPNGLPLKCVVCDRRHWVNERPRNGQIRTICRKCGRFIGYRPAGL